MACCQAGNKSKFEPMMTSSLTHTYVTKPQWVKPWHAEMFEGNRIYLNFLSLLDTEISQWTYDAITTSLWRQNDVTTSCWRHNDIIISSVGDGADACLVEVDILPQGTQRLIIYTLSSTWLMMLWRRKKSGPRLNIKTVLSTYGNFHVKDKTAVRTSYL